MKLDDLKEEHLIEILKLYEKSCGFGRDFRDTMYQSPTGVLEHLKRFGHQEYRIGSKWEDHSKIFFETDINNNIEVRFSSNFDPKDRKGKIYKTATKAREEFNKLVMQYLNSQTPKSPTQE